MSKKWNFLPDMPEQYKDVLVAMKYEKYPIQAYWDGSYWKVSFTVRDSMNDIDVNNARLYSQELIYAWCELPEMPPILYCCGEKLIEFKTYGYNECPKCGKTYKRNDR